jgi:hypothetical protein
MRGRVCGCCSCCCRLCREHWQVHMAAPASAVVHLPILGSSTCTCRTLRGLFSVTKKWASEASDPINLPGQRCGYPFVLILWSGIWVFALCWLAAVRLGLLELVLKLLLFDLEALDFFLKLTCAKLLLSGSLQQQFDSVCQSVKHWQREDFTLSNSLWRSAITAVSANPPVGVLVDGCVWFNAVAVVGL